MAYAELTDGQIVVQTDWVEMDLARQVPGLNHHSASDRWRGHVSWATYVTLHGVFGERLRVSPELYEWFTQRWYQWYEPVMVQRDMMGLGIDDQSAEAQVIRSWRTDA